MFIKALRALIVTSPVRSEESKVLAFCAEIFSFTLVACMEAPGAVPADRLIACLVEAICTACITGAVWSQISGVFAF